VRPADRVGVARDEQALRDPAVLVDDAEGAIATLYRGIQGEHVAEDRLHTRDPEAVERGNDPASLAIAADKVLVMAAVVQRGADGSTERNSEKCFRFMLLRLTCKETVSGRCERCVSHT